MNWQIRPSRAPGLEINTVVDGYIIVQADRQRLHYLNQTAVVILEACDGGLLAAELPALLASLCNLIEPPVDDVERCLSMLLSEGLLVDTTGTNRA